MRGSDDRNPSAALTLSPTHRNLEILKPEGSETILGGSWDLVSKVISPLIGVISNYKYSYLIYNPSY